MTIGFGSNLLTNLGEYPLDHTTASLPSAPQHSVTIQGHCHVNMTWLNSTIQRLVNQTISCEKAKRVKVSTQNKAVHNNVPSGSRAGPIPLETKHDQLIHRPSKRQVNELKEVGLYKTERVITSKQASTVALETAKEVITFAPTTI